MVSLPVDDPSGLALPVVDTSSAGPAPPVVDDSSTGPVLPGGLPPWQRPFFGVLATIIVSATTATVATGLGFPYMLTALLSVMLGIASIVFTLTISVADNSGSLMISGVLIVSGVGIFCGIYQNYRIVGMRVAGISVRQAPDHPYASYFHFNDGHVILSLIRFRDVRDRHGLLFREYMAPLVGHGWTRSTPIPAWVAWKSSAGYMRGWSQPWRAGLRMNTDFPEHKALVRSFTNSGYRIAPGAPLLHWSPSPENEAWRTVKVCLRALFTAALAWTAMFIIHRLYHLRQGSS